MKLEKVIRINRIYELYHNKVEKIEESLKPKENSRFNDVTGNLLGIMCSVSSAAKDPDFAELIWTTHRKDYFNSLKALSAYLSLIESSEKFKHAELYTHEGYFPDIKCNGNGSCHIEYVEKAREQLLE